MPGHLRWEKKKIFKDPTMHSAKAPYLGAESWAVKNTDVRGRIVEELVKIIIHLGLGDLREKG